MESEGLAHEGRAKGSGRERRWVEREFAWGVRISCGYDREPEEAEAKTARAGIWRRARERAGENEGCSSLNLTSFLWGTKIALAARQYFGCVEHSGWHSTWNTWSRAADLEAWVDWEFSSRFSSLASPSRVAR